MYPGGRQDTRELHGYTPDVPWWTTGHLGTARVHPRCTLVDDRTLGNCTGTPPMYPGGRQDTRELHGYTPDVPWWTTGTTVIAGGSGVWWWRCPLVLQAGVEQWQQSSS